MMSREMLERVNYMKAILKMSRQLSMDDMGRVTRIEACNEVFEDIYGVKNFFSKLACARGLNQIAGVLNQVGVEPLTVLFRSDAYMDVLREMISTRDRMIELSKFVKRIDKKLRHKALSRKDKERHQKNLKAAEKELRYVAPIYKESAKLLRKALGFRKPTKSSYKQQYDGLRKFVKRQTKSEDDLFWGDDDYDSWSDTIDSMDFDSDFDDDDDRPTGNMTAFEREIYNSMHANDRRKRASKRSSAQSRRMEYDEDDDDDEYEDDIDDEDDDADVRMVQKLRRENAALKSRAMGMTSEPDSDDYTSQKEMRLLMQSMTNLGKAMANLANGQNEIIYYLRDSETDDDEDVYEDEESSYPELTGGWQGVPTPAANEPKLSRATPGAQEFEMNRDFMFDAMGIPRNDTPKQYAPVPGVPPMNTETTAADVETNWESTERVKRAVREKALKNIPTSASAPHEGISIPADVLASIDSSEVTLHVVTNSNELQPPPATEEEPKS